MTAQAEPGRRARATARARRDELILDALERLLESQPMTELDVEPIAAEAGITRSRFYYYFGSKHDALAALLRRLGESLQRGHSQPDTWFFSRDPDVRPRAAVERTIKASMDLWWPHRFVLREASDLWTAVPEVRESWMQTIHASALDLQRAIERERAVGVAPPGLDARLIAEGLIWQAERVQFQGWAEFPSTGGKEAAGAVILETWMRTIFMADDPDPEGTRVARP